MNILGNQKLVSALSKAERAHKILCEVGNNALAEEMARLITAVKEQHFVIGVVGSAKRGKSTLINGLIGRRTDECAPIGKLPATNVISIFGYSKNPSTKVVFADNTARGITEREICLYVTEQHNLGNSKHVRSVEVLGPFAGLENGVYLVDTPGANNALSAMHGDVLLEFLPVADALVFLVAADEPLTEAEQNLLKAIKGNNIRKLFFAINMVDRVESGDLDPDDLAQGIEHNRKILANVGFSEAAIYQISAKNYYEKQYDPGAEQLLAAVRELIAKDRVEVLATRLCERTKSVLEQCHAETSIALRECKASTQELEAERKVLEATRHELTCGKGDRERDFSKEWNAAFDDLGENLRDIRKGLIGDYSALIDKASPTRVPALATTIHADVQVCFSERLRPKMEECEKRLQNAMCNLEGSVQTVMLKFSTQLIPGATVQSVLKEGVKVAGAALPALITGTVSAALPGIVGGMLASTAGSIAASAPAAVAFAFFSPSTWLPAIFGGVTTAATSAGGATVAVGGAAVTGTLAAVAMPFAIGAFGLAAFRAYSTWRENMNLQKNDLKLKVIAMIDDGCSQVAEQIRNYGKTQSEIIKQFDQTISASIDQADKRLVDLLVNRPSPIQIHKIEEAVAILDKHILLLPAPGMDGGAADAGSLVSAPLVDVLRSTP